MHLRALRTDNPDVTAFILEGVSSSQNALETSDVLASHARSEGYDWYVPNELELSEERGALGHRILDRETVVALLASRWLAWFEGDNRDIGLSFLRGIAELWIAAARRTADPAAEVRRRKAEFMGWGRLSPPTSRLRILASYALQEQLSIIGEQLCELKEMPVAQRPSMPSLGAQLAEWRDVVVSLEEGITSTGVTSIRSQYAIDDFARSLRSGA